MTSLNLNYIWLWPENLQKVLAKKSKIERQFCVEIEIPGSPNGKECGLYRCAVKGQPCDRNRAKRYISALTDSEGTTTKRICLKSFCGKDNVEKIESQTSAVIYYKSTKNACEYIIQGTELSTTMAMTLLEKAVKANITNEDVPMTPVQKRPTKTSRRLSVAIQSSLKKTSQRGDYRNAPDAVKGAIASCLLNDEPAENGNKTGRMPSVILIDDDDDEMEDLAVIDFVSVSSEDEDDDVLIVDCTEISWTPSDEANKNEEEEPTLDKTPEEKTPTNNTETGVKEGNDVDTVTKALEKLETPSTVKLRRNKMLKPNAVIRPLVFTQSSTQLSSSNKTENNEVLTTKAVDTKQTQINVSSILKQNIKQVSNEDRVLWKRKISNKSAVELEEGEITETTSQTKRKCTGNKTPTDKRDKKLCSSKERNKKISKSQKKRKNKNKKNKRMETRKDKDRDDKRKVSVKPFQFSGPNCIKDPSKMNLNFADDKMIKIQVHVSPKRRDVKPVSDNKNHKPNDNSNSAGECKRVVYVHPTDTQNYDHKNKKSTNEISPHTVGVTETNHCIKQKVPVEYQSTVRPSPLNKPKPPPSGLRYIVIDGSNVAMGHGGNSDVFSCKGIRLCVEYFKRRGHQMITVFLPHWRKCKPPPGTAVTHRYELDALEKEGILVYTPSRKIGNKLVASYDDRFIIELAEREEGIIVSNDQYRDLQLEKRSWKKVIEERLLMYTFVRDHFMVPDDPLGRRGPRLSEFLRHPKCHLSPVPKHSSVRAVLPDRPSTIGGNEFFWGS